LFLFFAVQFSFLQHTHLLGSSWLVDFFKNFDLNVFHKNCCSWRAEKVMLFASSGVIMKEILISILVDSVITRN